jgi:hypothetical protein
VDRPKLSSLEGRRGFEPAFAKATSGEPLTFCLQAERSPAGRVTSGGAKAERKGGYKKVPYFFRWSENQSISIFVTSAKDSR